jgi:hypothetical protein
VNHIMHNDSLETWAEDWTACFSDLAGEKGPLVYCTYPEPVPCRDCDHAGSCYKACARLRKLAA